MTTPTPNRRLEMKRGDTLPALVCTLSDDGTAVDLTAAVTVRVLLRRTSPTPLLVVNRAATTATAEGVVTMQWEPADTAAEAFLSGEIEVTWPDGKVQTWPTFYVHIRRDLGP